MGITKYDFHRNIVPLRIQETEKSEKIILIQKFEQFSANMQISLFYLACSSTKKFYKISKCKGILPFYCWHLILFDKNQNYEFIKFDINFFTG